MLDRFTDWRDRADSVDLLEAAKRYGAVMKKAGREFKGPCPGDGGTDRFSLSTIRHRWYCRGGQCGGHGAISMVQHIAGLSFLQACEALTGEPCPTGPARPLSETEKAERNRQRIKMEQAQRVRQEQEAQYQGETTAAAQAIWNASGPIGGTLAEQYLVTRGIPIPDEGWPDVLRFNAALPYPGKHKLPAMVCRVDDVAGSLTAVWRIYLRADGRKADVPETKLGLGPAGGGAVRLFGTGREIAIAEGVETALGYWTLTCGRAPCWAALSTSGLIGFESPLGIEKVVIASDGDRPIRKRGDEYEPAVPAGRKAAQALHARLIAEGIRSSIAAEPPMGKDWLDLWNAHAREVA